MINSGTAATSTTKQFVLWPTNGHESFIDAGKTTNPTMSLSIYIAYLELRGSPLAKLIPTAAEQTVSSEHSEAVGCTASSLKGFPLKGENSDRTQRQFVNSAVYQKCLLLVVK